MSPGASPITLPARPLRAVRFGINKALTLLPERHITVKLAVKLQLRLSYC